MNIIRMSAMLVLMILLAVVPAFAEETGASREEINDMQGKFQYLEKQPKKDAAEKTLSSLIPGIDIAGGISAGWFYTSHPGEGASDKGWLISNLLVEVSQKDKTWPVGFTVALGQTSTPSLLDAPEATNDIRFEYAYLTLTPIHWITAEFGLLEPNAGYEDTYTFNNSNIFLGAVASQQPYNAYGGRLGFDVKGVHICGGYYKKRLDREEYETDDSAAKDSWEIGVSGTYLHTDIDVYHYHLESLKNLTGIVLQHTVGNFDFVLNVDYWRWDGSEKGSHGDDDSIGGAFYVVPHIGNFSIPLRLEYIDQGESGIYLDSPDAKQIYTCTLSPTYHFLGNAFVRADVGYVYAKDGFTDDDGNLKSDRVFFAFEAGYTF